MSEYLRSLSLDDAARAAVFFTGRPFPRLEERILGAGGSLIVKAVGRLAAVNSTSFETVYRRHGDLGAMTEEILRAARNNASQLLPPLGLPDLQAAFEELSRRRGTSQKGSVVEELLRRADPLESKYIVKIMTGDLRIGLKESLVEEAIARAFGRRLVDVQRANMLLGDIGETLRLAARGALGEASLRLFNPIACMLATPVENAAEAIELFPSGAFLEDKYDGIRAQAHKRASEAKFFSRTLDEIFEFPELNAAMRSLSGEFVLDGEIVAWRDRRALPFTELQQRLGRKQLQLGLWSGGTVPAVYMAFDLLYRDGQLLLDLPLVERRRTLESLLANASGTESKILLSPVVISREEQELEGAFESALARGNEGLMAKDPNSPYTPGGRGQSWLKFKRPMATLDVVVTAVEYGHGKRHHLLSDYTFSVRASALEGNKLLTIGKAYSGLTDAEISNLTEYFKQHTLEDYGFRRSVEPTIVLEVAFNNIQRSDRHESGYALRFPRIVRLRPDKPVSEIDTLDRVKELYALSPGAHGNQL